MKTILSLFNRGPGLAISAALLIAVASFALFNTVGRPSSSPVPAPQATATSHLVPFASPTIVSSPSTATPQATAKPAATALASPTALPGTVTPAASQTATPRWSAEKIQVVGERPVDPTGNAIFLGWSPKGDKILFRKSSFIYIFSRNARGEEGLIGDLWIIDVNGSGRRLIAKAVGTWSWSLDGKYLAYSAPALAEGTQGNLYVVDTTTFQEKKLSTITFTTLPPLQWLPSDELTFLRNGYIFAIRLDGTGERQLNNIYLTPPGLSDAYSRPRYRGQYQVSPNGKRIAYWNTTFEDSPLWLANIDGSGAVKITDNGGAYGWSPDGMTLAFWIAVQKRSEIWLVNADGTNPRRGVGPTADSEFTMEPAWSPDGQVLAFIRMYQPSYDVRTPQPIPPLKYELWIMNRDSTQVRILYDKVEDTLRWAPHGLAIGFNRSSDKKFSSINAFVITLSLSQ